MTQSSMPTAAAPASLHPWRRRALQTTLALALGGSSLLGAGVVALAQDGSGGATPIPTPVASCAVPDLAAAKPTVTSAPSPTATTAPTKTPASPAASPVGGTPGASPVASETATASATAIATTPAAASPVAASDDTATAELTLSAKAVADCLSKGDFTTLASITGDSFRGQLIGAESPVSVDDFTEIAPSLTVIPYTITQVDDASVSGSNATATVTYLIGNQIRVGEWAFTKESVGGKDVWALDKETPKAAVKPDSATASTITIKDSAYTIEPDTIDGTEVYFSISNKDAADHEVFVVKLDKGTDVDVLVTTPGPGLPVGVTFVGQVTVPAGSDSDLLLADLEPGTYQVVDLLPNDKGLPHLSDGMEATFTVK